MYGISLKHTGRSGTYNGEKCWGLRHGKGTMKYDDNSSYDGMWAFGVWYGLATETFCSKKTKKVVRITSSWTGLFKSDWTKITLCDGFTATYTSSWFGPPVMTEATWSDGLYFEGLFPEIYFEGYIVNTEANNGTLIAKLADGRC